MTRARDVANIDGILTTKGDIYAASAAATPARLAAGTNGQVLTADSTASTGLAYTTPSGPAFYAFRQTTAQTFSANTWTKLQFNSESFDTNSDYDSTTNYRFTPDKAGYYQIDLAPVISRSGSGLLYSGIWQNGSEQRVNQFQIGTADTFTPVISTIIYLNGTTDYIEAYVYDQAATSRSMVNGVGQISNFSAIWIRS